MWALFPDVLNLIFTVFKFREWPSTCEIHETKSTAKYKTYTVFIYQEGNHIQSTLQHTVCMWFLFCISMQKKHCVLKSAHPSPLSAHRGFLGNKHFSQTNKYLEEHGRKSIDWNYLPKTLDN